MPDNIKKFETKVTVVETHDDGTVTIKDQTGSTVRITLVELNEIQTKLNESVNTQQLLLG